MPKIGDIVVGDDLIDRVLTGGYPEALTRSRWNRRQDWYLDYIDAIVQRDVRDTAQFEKIPLMSRLLRVLAEHSGQLVNHSGFGAPLGMKQPTTRRYTGVFESQFLVCNLQPCFSNTLKRLTKTPKLHFLVAGLLAALRDITPDRLRKNKALFDKERNEVDIVIEDRRGRVVGIEVKASATVAARDFAGIRRLSEACGDKFMLGLVLQDHEHIVPFGERLLAAPISALW